jgi:hypothetical protein
MEKIEKMEALVQKLGLSQEDLEHWISERFWNQWTSERLLLDEQEVAPLPLVYCDNQELYLSLEWDPEAEDILFGFVLGDRVIVSLAQNLPSIEDAQKIATSVAFANGEIKLPTKDDLRSLWTARNRRQVYNTLLFLRRHGVAPDRLNLQATWCFSNGKAESFTLRNDLFAQKANVLMLL